MWPAETQASCTPWDAFLLFSASSVQASALLISPEESKKQV